AITGTNGKTTTTSLTHHILTEAGLDAALVGNIGISFAKQIAERDAAYYVLEISSFQLDDCYDFHPYIAMILNISENHLDRYDYKMDGYAESKFRLISNLAHNDYFIYGYDSYYVQTGLSKKKTSAHLLPFSLTQPFEEGAWLNSNKLFIKHNQNTFTMNLNQLNIRGAHNAQNAMAAGLAASALNLNNDSIRESMSSFRSLEHRLEETAIKRGVLYINDSKATNVNSVWYALESMDQPVVWIAGGIDKGNDYTKITDLVREKVKAIVCLGKDNRKIHEAFSKVVDLIVNTESMEDAVRSAAHFSNSGDVVLLSPACASFDLFENYEERGHRFKQVVRALPE
ncbi:MAG TPA: UDP-N-acetylmuramoyl-L-alanine--D-glutamate ligase, partial [Bacteroidetes bacterium]|nr:UDP-N-acetylmuramoyl-L-alanine--D-glutamate ligase [Bacteroidota bacterium]